MDQPPAAVRVRTAPVPLPHWEDDPAKLTQSLSAHPVSARIHWMRSLGAAQLRRLWKLSTRRDLPWPPSTFDGEAPVVCTGKNHLLVFSWFAKHMARVGDEIVGFNDTGFLRALIGDGVFVVTRDPEDPSHLWIDYTRVPKAWPESLPARRTRPALLERMVYGGLKDEIRRVGGGLCIGRSAVTGNPFQRGAWFALWIPTLEDGELSPDPR